MIEFDNIKIKDFLSIGKIDFPLRGKGVTLITGRGTDAFSSNGCGKSALMESLIWTIFGRTIRDIPLDDDVIRRDAKTALVTVSFSIDGAPYTAIRSKTRGKAARLEIRRGAGAEEDMFVVGSVVEKTRELGKLLQTDFETFCNTTCLPQGRFDFFIHAGDQGKKQVFDQMVGTEYFHEIEARAKESLVGVQADIMTASARISLGKTDLASMHRSVEEWEELRDTETTRMERDLQALEEEISQLEASQAGQQSELSAAEMVLGAARKAVTHARERENEYNKVIHREEIARRDMVASSAMLDGLATQIETQIRRSNEYAQIIEKGVCPTCKQNFIDTSSIDAFVQELMDSISALEEKHAGQAVTVTTLEQSLKVVEKEVEDLNYDDTVLETAVTRAEHAEGVQRGLSERAERVDARLQEKRQTRDGRRTLAETQIQEATAKVKAVADQIIDSQNLVQEQEVLREGLEKRLEQVRFWVEGFGPRGLRSLIFENMMPFINERANYYSSRLTGGEITVEISATTALKSGDLREKISVRAINERGASVYGGNSGGEKKRVDLSILLALQDFIANRSGAAIKLAFFDEVMDELDEEGVQRTVDLLQELAIDKPVFVISHSESLKSFFEDRIEVVKENGVSRLEA